MALRQRKVMNQINVVPYIDVMLVLLVIFMVTAPLANPAAVDLPSVGKSSAPPPAPIEVVIRADQSLLMRDRAASGKAGEERQMGNAGELAAQVRGLQAKRADAPVVIAADKDVKYDIVLRVMDELRRNDVQRIALAVKPAAR